MRWVGIKLVIDWSIFKIDWKMKVIYYIVLIIFLFMWKLKCVVVILFLILGFELEIFFEFDELVVFIFKG